MADNPYIKQFPHLMRGKTVMYVHGFLSSGQSGTVASIRQLLPEARVAAFDIPIRPQEAIAFLKAKAAEVKPDLIIGTSMGGMMAEQLKGYDRILVNPAFEMGSTMHEQGMMGRQTFQNPRQDGVQEVIVTKQLVKEYRELTQQCFADITPEEQQRVWGAFGDADPVVHTFDLFCQHYTQAAHFHGEHRLVDKSLIHGVVPIIRWIDDRQEHRQRPVVYIGWDTLKDSYGRAKSSLLKAFETLIDSYDVYVVAPQPTNEPAFCPEVVAWCQEYLGTASHDHVVFTNRRDLLLGDYLISSQPCPGFMGSVVDFGSDDLKTWEDIIVFFSRLGGQ